MGMTKDVFDEYGNYKFPDYANTQYTNYATTTDGKMGMPIEDSRESTPMSKEEIVDTLKTMVFGVQAFERFNAKERETLDKSWNIIDQYETRLKADMVAMLTEIQLEIEEKKQYYQDKFLEPNNAVHEAAMGGRMFGCGECKEIIQQKINSLKES